MILVSLSSLLFIVMTVKSSTIFLFQKNTEYSDPKVSPPRPRPRPRTAPSPHNSSILFFFLYNSY